MKTPQEINQTLAGFYGSESYAKYGQSLLTDGIQYLAQAAECFWFLDIINSIQHLPKVKNEYFQTFKLTIKNNKAKVICTDGNDNVLYTQNIEYTDFPLDTITLWRVNGTIMNPSEY
jgi:hypothetical protein